MSEEPFIHRRDNFLKFTTYCLFQLDRAIEMYRRERKRGNMSNNGVNLI